MSFTDLGASRVKFIAVLIAMVFNFSCQEEKTVEMEVKPYFDLKGFIDGQIKYLDRTKPKVNKTALLGTEKESGTRADIDWAKELELFKQADINKPSYVGSYNIIRPDSSTFEYKLKKDFDLPVQYLKITIDTLLQKPAHLQAIITSANRIYKSERKLDLICHSRGGEWVISSYTVDGYQQLAFMSRQPYLISGKIGL